MAIINRRINLNRFNKKSNKNQKDKPNFTKGILGKTAYNKIGHFKESTGGGTPIPKGEKLKDHPEAKRVSQPRDEQGRFTYNSMNRKTREHPYHAKKKVNGKWVKKKQSEMSIPPVVRNVDFGEAIKSKDRIIYNGKLYVTGVDISKEDFLNMYREYKHIEGEAPNSDRGFGEIAAKELGRKQGRQMSKAEKQVTRTTKEGLIETAVRNRTKVNKKKYRHGYYKKTGN